MNTANESKAAGSPDYQVRLDVFEGPLDLLLYLVRKEEVEIYELSLERIVRQYLDYLAAVPQPDLDRAGDFIAMAAHLQGVEINRLDLFARPPGTPPAPGEDEAALAGAQALRDIGVFDLLGAFQRLLRRVEARQAAPLETVIFEENFTVADKIEHVRGLVRGGGGRPLAFTALFAAAASRVEMVVTLLALLELVRLRQLRVTQAEAFEEIYVSEASGQAIADGRS